MVCAFVEKSRMKKDNLTHGYDLNSPAVTTHLSIAAEIINRLANNSNYCKTTCVAVATVFATFTRTPDWKSLLIWMIPIFAIALLDSLFVYLKKRLTCEEEEFVSQFLTADEQKIARAIKEKFCLKSEGKRKDIEMLFPFVASSASKSEMFCGMLRNLGDISVLLFYGAMIITLVLVFWFSPSELFEAPNINSIQIINEQTRF